jgi:hypothetical protein
MQGKQLQPRIGLPIVPFGRATRHLSSALFTSAAIASMKPRITRLSALARVPACPRAPPFTTFAASSPTFRPQHVRIPGHGQLRNFAIARVLRLPEGKKFENYDNSNARPAIELDHHITQEEKDDFQRKLEEDKGKQIRTPWHREGSDTPPVARQRSAGAMTKGISTPDSWPSYQSLTKSRKTPDHPFPHAQAHPPSHNPRRKHRPQRR